jgi:hypothetical protein
MLGQVGFGFVGIRVGKASFVFDFILPYVFVLHQCVVARIWPSQSLIDMTFTPEIKATPTSVQGISVDFYFRMDVASPYRPETCSKLQCAIRTYISLKGRCP